MSKIKHFHKAPPPAEPDLLAKYEPYVMPVAIGVLAVLVLYFGWMFWRSRGEARVARQWQEFSLAYFDTRFSKNPDSMSQFSERFGTSPAGLAAEQIAGDYQMRKGLESQIADKESARKELEAARRRFEKIVDIAPQKEGLMYERAIYSLAYASESLGDCRQAILWYEKLAENPESAFAEAAARGIERCQLAEQVGFFAAFDQLDLDVSATAPGESVPQRPDISYPDPSPPVTDGAPSSDPAPTADSNSDPAPAPKDGQ
jgi:tetratricopeptide (TPR) repeat protein